MTDSNPLNSTPASQRIHIGFFGKRNAGKSSVVNAILGQDLAIVSEVKGTTTDPVYKAMELLPLGPVMIIDTPGIDDEGELGQRRIAKSKQVMRKTDVAVLVVDATYGLTEEDMELIYELKEKKIPYLIAVNKIDLTDNEEEVLSKITIEQGKALLVSASTKYHIHELKEAITTLVPQEDSKLRIVGDILEPMDFVVLVVPIDKAAPKGRLILPQQQTIRDILESDATAIVVKEYELKDTLMNLGKKPKLVITDSQVFAKVSADTPKDIMLTSFSILFAKYKGDLKTYVNGAKYVEDLQDKDKILISEGCTHHRQCDDIGTVKLPRWIKNYTKKDVVFEFTQGTEFPEDLSQYKLVVHCGGCMLNQREIKYRQAVAKNQQVPITNYGILIAYMQGILKRSLEPFKAIAMELED